MNGKNKKLDKEFLVKLADLMEEYEMDFYIDMVSSYEGEFFNKFTVDNKYGDEIFASEAKCIEYDRIREEATK
jgi:hypothetical protein